MASAAPAGAGFASVNVPIVGVCVVHRCDGCGAVFQRAFNATRHLETVAACAGAAIKRAKMGLLELPDDYDEAPCSGKPGTATLVVRGDGNHVSQTIDNSTTTTTIQTLNIIVTGSELGDLVKSGSLAEGELIRRTILENADLRRMVRVVENAPGAIFQLTRGTGGPRRMRNVKLEGGRVAELTEGGVVTSAKIEYCKKTAVELVDHLQRALASVGPDAPPDLREWAAHVRAELRRKLQGDVDYVQALTLYRDASSRFYKLPAGSREAIAENVKGIQRLIDGGGAPF
jgi:hypothetical protein